MPPFDPNSFLSKIRFGAKLARNSCRINPSSRRETGDAVFYILRGRIELRVSSARCKEAALGLLGAGEFFGEGCLAGQPLRMSASVAVTECTLIRIEKAAMVRVLHEEPSFSEHFVAYLLTRNVRFEEDLIDQLFNSSEKRLARLLLLLSNYGKDTEPESVLPAISQETLAAMIGTTRSRVSFFMNKFRKLGFIEYNGHLEVHRSLLSVVLHD